MWPSMKQPTSCNGLTLTEQQVWALEVRICLTCSHIHNTRQRSVATLSNDWSLHLILSSNVFWLVRWCTTARFSTVWTTEAPWPHFSLHTQASPVSPRHQVMLMKYCHLIGQLQMIVLWLVNFNLYCLLIGQSTQLSQWSINTNTVI